MTALRLTAPELAIVLSGALWGLYWIPVRYLEARGVGVVWFTLAVFVAGLVLLVPVVVRWPGARAAFTPRMLVTGFLTGGAFVLYSIAIALTEVVTAILLFYLSPVWATVLGRFVLAERLTGARLAALGLGLGGLWVVLGGESGAPLPRNLGDWFALVSGIAWAAGTIRVHQDAAVSPAAHVTSLFVGGTAATALIALLPPVDPRPPGSSPRGRPRRDRPRRRGGERGEHARRPVGGAAREPGARGAAHDDGGGDGSRLGRRVRRRGVRRGAGGRIGADRRRRRRRGAAGGPPPSRPAGRRPISRAVRLGSAPVTPSGPGGRRKAGRPNAARRMRPGGGAARRWRDAPGSRRGSSPKPADQKSPGPMMPSGAGLIGTCPGCAATRAIQAPTAG